MKLLKTAPLALALLASLGVASSASAANWDPQGTAVTATQVGTGSLTAGQTVSCTSGDASLVASGAVATAQGTTNPVRFSGCTAFSGLFPVTVHTAGTWSFTAVNTTTVDAKAVNAGGNVATITVGNPVVCTITVPSGASGVTIAGNSWSNGTRQLVTNGASSFAVHPEGSNCAGVNTSAVLETTFSLPAGVQIT